MKWISYFPGLICFFLLFVWTPERAFLSFYLPILLLLPQIFTLDVQGIPDLGFAQTAIIPIYVVALAKRWTRWQFSLMDFLILFYFWVCIYSEYSTSDEAFEPNLSRKLFYLMLCSVVFPYALAKVLIYPSGLIIKFIKRFVFLIFLDILFSMYEMRFVRNPYISFFETFFPGQGLDWPVLFRYGLVRITGPFVQPILFGIVIGMALLFHYWMTKHKYWEHSFHYLPPMIFSKSTIIFVVLLLGMFMTLSRGPWYSTMIGGIFLTVGNSHMRLRSFIMRSVILLVVFFAMYETYSSYLGVDKYMTSSEELGNIAYRSEMNEMYGEVVMRKPLWGWGTTNWPKFGALKSVDNHYMFTLLNHGFMGLISLLAIMLVVMARLFFRGINVPKDNTDDSSFAFAMFSVFLMTVSALSTVYMGVQVEPMFFILVGLSDSYLNSRYRTFHLQA